MSRSLAPRMVALEAQACRHARSSGPDLSALSDAQLEVLESWFVRYRATTLERLRARMASAERAQLIAILALVR